IWAGKAATRSAGTILKSGLVSNPMNAHVVSRVNCSCARLLRMTSSEIPIWQEPVRGFYADPGQFLALSGLDLLRSEGSSLPPPIGYLCGLQLSAVEPGSTTFTMPVTDWLLSPQGAVSGATLSFLVDAPLGCTVQTALPPATPYSTA